MVWDRVPIYWSSQNENHLSLKTLLRHTLLLLLPVTHPVTLSCPPLSLLTIFRCTGSLPLLLLAVTHPVTLSGTSISCLKSLISAFRDVKNLLQIIIFFFFFFLFLFFLFLFLVSRRSFTLVADYLVILVKYIIILILILILSLLTLFRCTGSLPLLLLAVTHPVTLSCPPLSLLTLFRCIGSLPLTMICTKGYLPRAHQFQVHLLQNVLDSQIQIIAPCGGKSSCHLHRFSATEWDFGGRAANADQAALA